MARYGRVRHGIRYARSGRPGRFGRFVPPNGTEWNMEFFGLRPSPRSTPWGPFVTLNTRPPEQSAEQPTEQFQQGDKRHHGNQSHIEPLRLLPVGLPCLPPSVDMSCGPSPFPPRRAARGRKRQASNSPRTQNTCHDQTVTHTIVLHGNYFTSAFLTSLFLRLSPGLSTLSFSYTLSHTLSLSGDLSLSLSLSLLPFTTSIRGRINSAKPLPQPKRSPMLILQL